MQTNKHHIPKTWGAKRIKKWRGWIPALVGLTKEPGFMPSEQERNVVISLSKKG